MKIGYARVSKNEQNLDLQLLALEKAGCKKIFQEKISGRKKHQPQLEVALAALKKGDTLVVWHLDRLGRKARELINMEYEFNCQGIELIALIQKIDTKTPIGIYNFHLTCANAQLESAITSERTKAGLQAARHKGKKLGRPLRSFSDGEIEAMERLFKQRHSFADISDALDIPQTTIWRTLSKEK